MSVSPENALPKKIEHQIHLDFIRKVYGILSVQLLLTALCVALTTTVQALQDFFAENYWIFFITLAVSLVCAGLLICFRRKCGRKVPLNYLLLFAFTFSEAVCVSCVCAAYDPITILIAAGLTLGLITLLTAYAVLTRREFSIKISIGLVLLYALLLLGILLGCFRGSKAIQIVSARQVASIVFIILFGIYLVLDTQKIVKKGRWSISMDDYVIGALIIYADVIGIFLEMLRIVGNATICVLLD